MALALALLLAIVAGAAVGWLFGIRGFLSRWLVPPDFAASLSPPSFARTPTPAEKDVPGSAVPNPDIGAF